MTFTTVNAASNGFSYDAAGNVTFDNVNDYTYDNEGRLCAVQTWSLSGGTVAWGYLYDAEGRRVAKGSILASAVTSNQLNPSVCNAATNGFTPTETYVLGPSGEELTSFVRNGQTMTFERTNVYADAVLFATDGASGLHFHISDPLGTRRVQTDGNGLPE